MESFSNLYPTSCYISLKACFIDYMYTFCDVLPQNSALALKCPLPVLRFVLFLLKMHVCTQRYCYLQRFPAIQDSTLALARGLFMFTR